jgi:hypothetical protein
MLVPWYSASYKFSVYAMHLTLRTDEMTDDMYYLLVVGGTCCMGSVCDPKRQAAPEEMFRVTPDLAKPSVRMTAAQHSAWRTKKRNQYLQKTKANALEFFTEEDGEEECKGPIVVGCTADFFADVCSPTFFHPKLRDRVKCVLHLKMDGYTGMNDLWWMYSNRNADVPPPLCAEEELQVKHITELWEACESKGFHLGSLSFDHAEENRGHRLTHAMKNDGLPIVQAVTLQVDPSGYRSSLIFGVAEKK